MEMAVGNYSLPNTNTQWAGIPYKPDVTIDSLKSGATTAAKATGNALGKSIFILDGSWCDGAVKQFQKSLPKNTLMNRLKNLFKFNWKEAINNEYINKNMPKATQQAPKGFFGKIGNFLGKIPGMKFLGKHFGPIMLLATSLPAIYKGFKDGGLAEGLKEIARAGLQQVGYIAAMFVAGTILGLGGLPLMVAGIGGSILLGMGIDKIVGKSLGEKEAELAEQQKTNKGRKIANAGRNLTTAQLEQDMKAFTDVIHKRNNSDLTLPSLPGYYA